MASRYLHEEAYVDVLLATHQANITYPYRLQQVKESSPTTADRATKHILDSSIGKEYTNEDVIEKADHLGVSTVVPCDSIGDHEETVVQVMDMLERADSCGYTVVVPIQGDGPDGYDENTGKTRDMIDDHGYSDVVDRYAVGGVKDMSGDSQRKIAKHVCSSHDDLDWHMFGAGMSREWVTFIRSNPDLLTSVDMATPVYAANSNEFVLYDMERITTQRPRGTNVSYTNARMVEAMLTNYNYLISDGPRSGEVEELLGQKPEDL